MILEPSDTASGAGGLDSQDFLLLRHGESGFLVERSVFFASIYLEETVPVDSSAAELPLPEYLNKTMEYNGETLLVYDLDYCLAALFGMKDPGRLKIALITETDRFAAGNLDNFKALAEKLGSGISSSCIAFKVGSQAEIHRIDLRNLRLFPGRLREELAREGILGCRFPGEGAIDFIVDIESIVFNNLTRTESGDAFHENTAG